MTRLLSQLRRRARPARLWRWLPVCLSRFRCFRGSENAIHLSIHCSAGYLWRRFTSWRWSWLLMACLLALAARIPRLAADSVWYDEAFTEIITRLPFLDVVRATVGDVHPPGYYLLIAAWRQLVSLILPVWTGPGDVLIRLPSVAIGILTVIETYKLTWRIDSRLARWSALATAILPAQINYSQEARGYQLLAWLVLLAARGVMDKRWSLVTLTGAAAMYTHNLAALYLVVIGVWSMFVDRRRASLAWLIAAAIYSPWLIGLVNQLSGVGSEFWVTMPGIGDLSYTVMYVTVFTRLWPEIAPLALIAAVGMTVISIIVLIRNKRYWPIIALAVLPPLIMFAISKLWTPVYIYRIAFPSSAFMVILWLAGFQHLAKPDRRAVASIMLPVLAASLIGYYAHTGQYDNDWRLPADIIDDHWQEDDQVWHVTIPSYILIDHYLPGVNSVLPFASDLSQSLTPETKSIMRIRESTIDNLPPGRVWIMFADTPLTSEYERAAMFDALDRYPIINEWIILDHRLVDVELYLVEKS
jgi:hypothetical protein